MRTKRVITMQAWMAVNKKDNAPLANQDGKFFVYKKLKDIKTNFSDHKIIKIRIAIPIK